MLHYTEHVVLKYNLPNSNVSITEKKEKKQIFFKYTSGIYIKTHILHFTFRKDTQLYNFISIGNPISAEFKRVKL